MSKSRAIWPAASSSIAEATWPAFASFRDSVRCCRIAAAFFDTRARSRRYSSATCFRTEMKPGRPYRLSSGGKYGRPGFISVLKQVAELYRRDRSEEHTAELQSRPHLVCRLLL